MFSYFEAKKLPSAPHVLYQHHTIHYNDTLYIVTATESDYIYEYDCVNKTWVYYTNKIKGINFCSAVLYKHWIVIFGGRNLDNSPIDNCLNAFNLKSKRWEIITCENYDPFEKSVFLHSAVVYKDKMFIYGGLYNSFCVVDDLWEYDFVNRRWKLLPNGSKRFGHSAAVYKDRMIVVGGQGDVLRYDDRFEIVECFNFTLNQWQVVKCTHDFNKLTFICNTCAVLYDSLFIFEERNVKGVNEIYELDLLTFSWNKVHIIGDFPKKKRTGHSLIAVNSSLIILGGITSTLSSFTDMYELRLTGLGKMIFSTLKKRTLADVSFNTSTRKRKNFVENHSKKRKVDYILIN